MPRLAVLGAALLLLAGCAPAASGPADWTLEPIPFDTALTARPGAAAPNSAPAPEPETVDVAFGMSMLAADGAGGFWAESGGSWLHVDAKGRTAARFDVEPDDPLAGIVAMAPVSETRLAVIRDEGRPALAVLDTRTMKLKDVTGNADDFAFGDLAVHAGDAYVVRYVPRPDAYVDFEVLRISLDGGARQTLYTAPLSRTDAQRAAPALPPVDVDVDDSGTIRLATPSARIVLRADGTERSSRPQTADRPIVAARPDGTALWWGGTSPPSETRGVIAGGSSDARASIESRNACDDDDPGLRSTEALRVGDGDDEHPLPFLCGANAAAWTGSSWVVAIGGEGDGVLVRLTPPKKLD